MPASNAFTYTSDVEIHTSDLSEQVSKLSIQELITFLQETEPELFGREKVEETQVRKSIVYFFYP